MSYKSTRRQWVKLWVNEWLDGTTRFELTAPQRLVWVDLLALAGRSRFPGFIYAGMGDSGKRVGYPVAYLAGVLQMDEVALNNTMKLLLDKGHITLEESGPEQYIIGIVNWEKYQSEYLRQKAYRKVTTKTTSRLPVEVEGEVDVEGEAEVERAKHATPSPDERLNVESVKAQIQSRRDSLHERPKTNFERSAAVTDAAIASVLGVSRKVDARVQPSLPPADGASDGMGLPRSPKRPKR